jgi:hypothetical protein
MDEQEADLILAIREEKRHGLRGQYPRFRHSFAVAM